VPCDCSDWKSAAIKFYAEKLRIQSQSFKMKDNDAAHAVKITHASVPLRILSGIHGHNLSLNQQCLYAFTTRPSHSTLLSTEGDESDGT